MRLISIIGPTAHLHLGCVFITQAAALLKHQAAQRTLHFFAAPIQRQANLSQGRQ